MGGIRWLQLGMVGMSFAACGGASVDQLRTRAAFDMDCPERQLQVVELDSRTRGVRGCGQRLTYVETCGMHDGYGGKHDCTWVLNTDTERQRRAEQRAPGP
jgi:hypothetical protein